MKRFLLFFLCAVLVFAASAKGAGAAEVLEIKVHSVISPPVAQFISDSIKQAENDKAQALLVELDTPGGLDTSMREIVKSIMESRVPVIVYVHPSGARAASAGAIILIASHVAAMTPGTNVGAAHPVNMGKEKMDKVMMAKVVQDAQAYARSLAEKRGRNADLAVRMVKESSSDNGGPGAQGARYRRRGPRRAGAPCEDRRQGRGGTRREGAACPGGAKMVEVETPFKYKLLSYISDPNVAYLLMMIGFYGILFEIYSPGTVFPGVIGGISLILAFYAFQTIPISYAGLFLIVLGIIFFVLEIKIMSHGLLSIAGIISLLIGSIMLIDLPSSWLSLSWKSILAAVLATSIFFLGVISYAIKAQLSKVKTGREGLSGEVGTASSDIAPRGKVFVHGELWDAISEEPIASGERVRIKAVDGMTLKVKKEGGP